MRTPPTRTPFLCTKSSNLTRTPNYYGHILGEVALNLISLHVQFIYHLWDIVVPVNREHDWKRGREVRGYLEEVGSLVQSLLHQLVLFIVKMLDGLLQITHTTVDELGAAAAGPGGEVIPFYEGCVEPLGGREGGGGGGSIESNGEGREGER